MRFDPNFLSANGAGRATIRRRGPDGVWIRLLGQILRLADGNAELVRHAERPWASATFTGTRHAVALSFLGQTAIESGETLIAELSEHEFDIPGNLVADAAVIEVTHTHEPESRLEIEIEVLLLEDL